MQSTHCCPTAADRRQSGQACLPQRTHDTQVSRCGCRKQVGGVVVRPPAPGPASGGMLPMTLALRALDLHGLEHDVPQGPVVPAGGGAVDRIDHLSAATTSPKIVCLPV